MFLSVSTSIYSDVSLAKAIEYIANTGFSSIEIFATHFLRIEKESENALSIAKKRKIKIYSMHGEPPPNSSLIQPNFESSYKKFYYKPFEFLRRCEGRVFVLHLGGGKSVKWDKSKKIISHNCQLLADMASQFNLILGIENEWYGGGLPKTPYQFKELIELVKRDNLGITLDNKHAAMSGQSGSEPEDFIKEVGEHIVNYHCTELEYPLFSVIELGDWGIPGTGKGMRFVNLIKLLKKTGYNGPITIELNESILRKVLEVVVKVLKDTNVDIKGGLEKILTTHPSLEDKILEYSREYISKKLSNLRKDVSSGQYKNK